MKYCVRAELTDINSLSTRYHCPRNIPVKYCVQAEFADINSLSLSALNDYDVSLVVSVFVEQGIFDTRHS